MLSELGGRVYRLTSVGRQCECGRREMPGFLKRLSSVLCQRLHGLSARNSAHIAAASARCLQQPSSSAVLIVSFSPPALPPLARRLPRRARCPTPAPTPGRRHVSHRRPHRVLSTHNGRCPTKTGRESHEHYFFVLVLRCCFPGRVHHRCGLQDVSLCMQLVHVWPKENSDGVLGWSLGC